jgi:hypothetical protein
VQSARIDLDAVRTGDPAKWVMLNRLYTTKDG